MSATNEGKLAMTDKEKDVKELGAAMEPVLQRILLVELGLACLEAGLRTSEDINTIREFHRHYWESGRNHVPGELREAFRGLFSDAPDQRNK